MATAVDRYAIAKTALAQIAHPVAIIGAAAEGERSCATGTTMYVSLAPALVAVAQHPGSRTARLIRASGEFSVSLLTASQQDVAEKAGASAPGPEKEAARPGEGAGPARASEASPSGFPSPSPGCPSFDKFAALKIPVLEPPAGRAAPAVAGSLAVLWCQVREQRETGDHLLFIGEVVAHRVDEGKLTALLRYRRRYARLGHFQSDEAPEGYPT